MTTTPTITSSDKIRILSNAKEISTNFSEAIDNIVFDEDFPLVISLLLNCEGKVITTGMGKAGIAMRKFASTLCSLGFPSFYVHPGEASHGELGCIEDEDILFVASTSGETREVLEIISLVKKIGIKTIIGITSHENSPIRNEADIVLDMGIVEEADHLKLAPTTSILVMLAITDAIALVASKEKGFTKENYGIFHHGGYLAKKARKQIN